MKVKDLLSKDISKTVIAIAITLFIIFSIVILLVYMFGKTTVADKSNPVSIQGKPLIDLESRVLDVLIGKLIRNVSNSAYAQDSDNIVTIPNSDLEDMSSFNATVDSIIEADVIVLGEFSDLSMRLLDRTKPIWNDNNGMNIQFHSWRPVGYIDTESVFSVKTKFSDDDISQYQDAMGSINLFSSQKGLMLYMSLLNAKLNPVASIIDYYEPAPGKSEYSCSIKSLDYVDKSKFPLILDDADLMCIYYLDNYLDPYSKEVMMVRDAVLSNDPGYIDVILNSKPHGSPCKPKCDTNAEHSQKNILGLGGTLSCRSVPKLYLAEIYWLFEGELYNSVCILTEDYIVYDSVLSNTTNMYQKQGSLELWLGWPWENPEHNEGKGLSRGLIYSDVDLYMVNGELKWSERKIARITMGKAEILTDVIPISSNAVTVHCTWAWTTGLRSISINTNNSSLSIEGELGSCAQGEYDYIKCLSIGID